MTSTPSFDAPLPETPEAAGSQPAATLAVSVEETTLCLLDNQSTNQLPTTPLPSHYLSARIKVGHSQLDVVLSKVLFDVPDYCIYKHSTGHEHFHVCLPGLGKSDTTRLGKRIRDNLRVSGNGGFSLKSHYNGCSSFVFYAGHEGTAAIYQDPRWAEIIASTDSYYVKQTGQTMLPMAKTNVKDQDADWQLTYANMVSKAINHARRNGLTGSLKEVLQHMLETTKWRPSFHLIKNGVPDHYYKDYEFRSGKRRKFDMDWMRPKF